MGNDLREVTVTSIHSNTPSDSSLPVFTTMSGASNTTAVVDAQEIIRRSRLTPAEVTKEMWAQQKIVQMTSLALYEEERGRKERSKSHGFLRH